MSRYIDDWFHFYETSASFEAHKNNGFINPDSICFLRETGQIFTQGNYFGICKQEFEELVFLVSQHTAMLKNIMGVEGPSQGDKVINNLKDIENFLSGISTDETLNGMLKALENALRKSIGLVQNDLNGKYNELKIKITNLESELDQEVDLLNSKIQKNATDIRSAEIRISTLESNLKAHLIEWEDFKATYNTFKEYVDGRLDSLDNQAHTLRDDITKYHLELESVKEGIVNFNLQVEHCNNLVKTCQVLVEQVEAKFDELEKDVDAFINTKGHPNGIAPLDADGKVPAQHLPSYVDDVLEFSSINAFPDEGEDGKIYVAVDTDLTYRWSGTHYVEISKSLALGETGSTAFPGDRGKKVEEDVKEHINDFNNPHKVTKKDLGLENVNNTSDEDKPVSVAQAAAIKVVQDDVTEHKNLKNNPHEVTKEQLGLGNVDNTSDEDKPLSNAQKAAIEAAKSAAETHIQDKNNPHNVTKEQIGLGSVNNTSDLDKPVSTAQAAAIKVVQDDLNSHEDNKSNPHGVTKEQLGLGNVNNTSDEDKPISKAQKAAHDVISNSVKEHIENQSNPHNVTKDQVGLGNVDNTSDKEKPISDATQDVLDTKVDKIEGKGLSTNDFTNAFRNKLEQLDNIRKLSQQEIDELEEAGELAEGELIYNTDKHEYFYFNGEEKKVVPDANDFYTKQEVDDLIRPKFTVQEETLMVDDFVEARVENETLKL